MHRGWTPKSHTVFRYERAARTRHQMEQPTKSRNATVRLEDLRALTELGLLRLFL